MASEPRMVEATATVMEVDFGSRQGAQRVQFGQAAPDLSDTDESLGVFPEASEPEAEETQPPRRWSGAMMAVLAVVAFGGVVWFAYKWGLDSGYRDEIPTMTADLRPIKVKPENPGGLVVPNQDKLVLHQSDEGAEQPVERLLSEPEVPVPLEPTEGAGPEIASITPTKKEEAESLAASGEAAEEAATEAAPAAPEPAAEQTVAAVATPEPAAPAAEPEAAPASQPKPEQTQAAAAQQIEASTAPAAGSAPAAGAASGQAGGASGASSGGGGAAAGGSQPAAVQVAAIQKGDYVIQLASVTSSDAANKEWSRLQKTFPGLLGDMSLSVQEATVKGTQYHRVQTGPFPSRATAQDMCAQIKAKQQACIVQRR